VQAALERVGPMRQRGFAQGSVTELDTEGVVEGVGRGLHVGVGHVRYSTSTACRPA